MSGHSKWHNIQAKKGKADAARGKIFTKLGRELLIAVKQGGHDPAGNSKLKDVIAKCKEKARARVQEYLKGSVIESLSDGNTFMKLTVEENEQFWIGTLLSLGDDVEVIAPKEIRKRLFKVASKIVSLYK